MLTNEFLHNLHASASRTVLGYSAQIPGYVSFGFGEELGRVGRRTQLVTNTPLVATDAAENFVFDVAADTGAVSINAFGRNDILSTTAKLFDSNNDGIITFGRDRKLGLDGPVGGDTVDLPGLEKYGLRYLGAKDGLHQYADARVRPLRANESRTSDDTMAGGKQQDVHFFDTALGIGLGTDKVTRFDVRDLFVTTSRLSDTAVGEQLALSDGVVAFGADRGTVRLTGLGGEAIDQLAYRGAVTHAGVTYHVYARVGSTAGPGDLRFVDGGAPSVSGPVTAQAVEDGETVAIDLLQGAKAGTSGGPLKIVDLGNLPAGLVRQGDMVMVDPGDDSFQSLAAGETRTIAIDYRIADSGGSNIAQTARITVAGLNDAPIADPDLAAEMVEDAGIAFINLLAGARDVDAGDRLSIVGLSGLPAGITLDGNRLRVDLDDDAFQLLAAGATMTREISFFVADAANARVERTLDLTVTGINDAPVVIGTIGAEAEAHDKPFTLDLLTGASDVDAGDRLSVTGVTGLGDGMQVDGSVLSVDPAAYADLGEGESRTITVRWTVTDGKGGTAARSADIVITGVGGEVPPTEKPVVTGFSDDSGLVGDRMTNDATPTLSGTAGANERVSVSIDGKAAGSAQADAAGRWTYTATTLADGIHDFGVRTAAGDGTGIRLTIDTVAPTATAGLARSSDTGTAGDGQTSAGSVTIVGTTEAGARVKVGYVETTAGANGAYVANGVSLALGDNAIDVVVTDAAGNSSTMTLDVERLGEGGGNVALQWNKIALQSIARDSDIPVEATRILAMVSIAAYDVLNAIDGAPALLVSLDAPDGVSAEAALAGAMAAVIAYSYPKQASIIAAALADTLTGLNLDKAVADASLAFGRDIGEAVIAIRDSDGWDAFSAYEGGDKVGEWRETEPAFMSAEAPQWGKLDPFLLTSGDQFRAGPPPALDSEQYAADYNEVKSVGAIGSTTRTADQTQIARFWADGLGSYTPGGHWSAIAAEAASLNGFGLTETARLFAMLNISLADSGIAGWDTKYTYATWRPITAIHDGDADGNDATVGDAAWQPLALTPAHPDYVSGHSTYSTAAATILSSVFGDAYAFSTTSLTAPGLTRSFDSFLDAANEAGRSRIYGGIHTESANVAGKQIGANVANFVLGAFDTSTDTRAPTIVVQAAKGLVGKDAPSLAGFAVDNLPGLSAITVTLDNGAESSVSVTGGRFVFDPVTLFGKLGEGAHKLVITASDAAGNLGSTSYAFTIDATAPTIDASLSSGSALTAATRIAGTADGTGSKIASLSYAVDGGVLRSVGFDPSGAFDTALDLSTLSPGAHSIRITATDSAGLTTTRDFTATLAERVPFAIEAITPADGAGEVGVTFKPEVRFTRAADAATLTNDSFYATDASGAKVPASIVVSADGLRAYLLFDSALPGASRIELHVDGDRIKARGDGVALDSDANGSAGGDLLTDFTTVSRSVVAGTSITGVVVGPGADLKPMTFDDFRVGPDQAANTKDDVYLEKIAGARVWVIGQEDKAVFTAADGSFTLTGVPSGNVKLAIDGRTSTNAPSGYFYPEMVMDLTIRPGVANTVMGTMGSTESQLANIERPQVYLPRISSASLTAIDDDEATTVSVAAEGTTGLTTEQQSYVKLVVQPGSLVDKDGNAVEAPTVGIATVPPELVRDMLPAGLLQHTFDITIQAPDAAIFTAPAQLTLPNVFNAAPGTKLNVLSFDHDTGRLVITGTATVSADGKFAVTDPDGGVTKPGWHGLTPPGTNTDSPPPPPPPPPCGQDKNEAGDQFKFWSGVLADIAKCAAELTTGKAKAIISIGAKLAECANQGYSLAENADKLAKAIAEGNNDQAIQQGIATLKLGKDIFKAKAPSVADDALGAINQAKALVVCANSLLSIANAACKAAVEDINCNPDTGFWAAARDALLKSVCTAIAGLKATASYINGLIEHAELTLGKVAVAAVCAAVEGALDAAEIWATAPKANGLQAFALAAETEALTKQQVLDKLASAKSMSDEFGAFGNDAGKAFAEAGSELDDNLDIVSDEGAQAQIARFVSAIIGVAVNAPFVVEVNGTELRGVTGANGEIDLFLPPEADFTVQVFDKRFNGVGTYSGVTARSGETTKLPAIGFVSANDLPDTDGDTLADVVEHILGTSKASSDTDGDGLSDRLEVELGTNPLGDIPLATGVVASLTLEGQARDITTLSDFAGYASLALIATGSAGLAIVDASNPLSPTLLGSIDLTGTATQIAADRQLGMVAVSTGSTIALVDIGDPAAPSVVRTITTPAADIVVLDGTLYVATGRSVTAFDMTTGEELQVLTLGSGNVIGLAREGNLLAAVDSSGVAYAVDLASELMVRKGSVSLGFTVTGDGADKIYLADGVLYVPATNGFQGGYGTTDFSDPTKPKVLSAPDDTSFAGNAIALNGSGRGVIVGNPGGVFGTNVLDVIDTSDPTNTGTFITRVSLPSAPSAVLIDRGFALVANGTSGLQVVNYLALDRNGEAPDVVLATMGLDVDPDTAGIQVLEGSVLRLNASVTDDVQVRDVAVLVDGVPVDSDGSYPFDLSIDVPKLGGKTSDTLTIQVRATDTGGNIGLSDTVQLSVVRDTIAPKLLASNLADGALLGQTFRTFRLSFSEPLDQDAVTTAAFRVKDADDTDHIPTNLLFKDGGRTVQLTFDAFDVGNHRFIVDQSKIVDRAGNPLGTGTTETAFRVQTFTVEWIGQGSGDWNTSSNWSTGEVPSETDEVFIQAAGDAVIRIAGSPVKITRLVTTETIKIDYNGNLSVTGGGDLAGLELTSNGSVTFDAATTIDTLTVSGGALQGAGAVTVDELFTWTGGTLAGTGDLTVASGATLDMGYNGTSSYNYLYLYKDMVLAGEGTFDKGQLYVGTYRYEGGYINTPGSLTVAEGGTLTLSDEYSDIYDNTLSYGSGERSSVTNAGTLVRSGEGTSVISTRLVNEGAATVEAGTLTLSGGGTGSGSMTVEDGASLQFGGGTFDLGEGVEFTADGTLKVTSGTVTIDETLDLTRIEVSGGTLVLTGKVTADAIAVTGGTLEAKGALSVDTLTLSNGTLQGAGAVTVDELFTWTGGTLAGTGDLTVASDATLDMGHNGNSSYSTLYLQKDVVLAGEGAFDKGQLYVGTYRYENGYINTPGSLTVAEGAKLTLSGEYSDIYDNTLAQGTGGRSSVTNAGTLVREGEGTSTISAAFSNLGTVTVEAGSLDLTGGGAGKGSYSIEATSTVEFGGGTFTLTDGVSFTGNGDLVVQGGSVTFAGKVDAQNLSVTGGTLEAKGALSVDTLTLSNGTLQGAGAVTVDELFTWTGGTLAGTGDLTVASDATLDMGHNGNSSYSTLYLQKDVVLAGEGAFDKGQLYVGTYRYENGYINTPGSLTVAEGAKLTLSGEYSDIYDNTLAQGTGGRSSVTNAGTLVREGEGTSTISAAFSNLGTVTVEAGSLDLTGGGAGKGSYSIEATSTVEFGGGTFTLTDGVSFTGNGDLVVQGGSVTFAGKVDAQNLSVTGGTLEAKGALSVDTLTLSNGTLQGAGAVTVDELFTWTGGTLAGTGDLTVASDATLDMGHNGNSSYSTLYLQKDVVLAGEGAFDKGQLYVGTYRYENGYINTPGSLTVAEGAKLTLSGEYSDIYDNTLAQGTGGRSSVTNAGTLVREGEGTSTISAAFSNLGTVTVEAGSLDLTGGGAGKGSYSIEATSTVEFGGGTFTLTDGVSFTGNGDLVVQGGSVTFAGKVDAQNLSVTGGTLEAKGALSVDTLTLSNGTLQGAGAVTVDELFTWTGGTLAGTGDLTVASDATLDMGHNGNSSYSTLYLQKDVVLAGEGAFDKGQLYVGTYRYENGYINTPGSLTVAEGAKLTLSGEYSDIYDNTLAQGTGGRSSVTNAGTLVREGEGTSTISAAFSNLGTVTVEAGSLDLTGGGAGKGSYSIEATSTVEFGGGTFTLTDGVSFTGNGDLVVQGGSVTFAGKVDAQNLSVTGGTLEAKGALSVDTLTLSNGTLQGAGAVTVDELFTWTGGTLAGTGDLTVASDATLDMGHNGNSSYSTLYLQKDVVLAGEGAFDKGQLYVGTYRYENGYINTPGSLTVAEGAKLTLSGEYSDIYDNTLAQGTGGRSSVTNAGTLVREGEGTSTISAAFSNLGTVTVEAGSLDLTGGGAGKGSYSIEATSTVEFGGGTFTLTDGVSFTGNGDLVVQGGSVTFAGKVDAQNLSVTGGTLEAKGALSVDTLTLSNGTLQGAGAVTVDELFTWTGGTLAGTGDLTVASDATLDIGHNGNSSYSTLYLQKDVVLAGEGAFDKGQLYVGTYRYENGYINTPGSLTVAEGAKLTLSGEYSDIYDNTLAQGTGGRSSVTNAGTLVREGEGTTTFDDALVTTNSGEVFLQGGYFYVNWDVTL